MNKDKQKKISKTLSYVLRHRPDTIGITLEDGGWIEVDTLLEALIQSGRSVSREAVERVVAENDKQRFEFNDDHSRIRARQGHSVVIDLGYEQVEPPDVLFHGTASRNLDAIFEQGLLKGKRHHVHMSVDKKTMLAVAQRHGKPVLLRIDAAAMHADGHLFFVTGNNVWLTDHVPPAYLTASD